MNIWKFCAISALVLFLFPGSNVFSQSEAKLGTKSVIAVFSLNGPFSEAPLADDFLMGPKRPPSLLELVSRMKKSSKDDSVKAVVLLLENLQIGSAQRDEIRQAIDQIRQAGKDVLAHVDSLSTSSYVLLSGASKLSVVPTGDIWINGIYAESPYIRGLLDKVGVKPDYLTCGDFKSAAEIFMRTGPSPEAERMLNWLLDSQYDAYLRMIADGRNVKPDKVRQWIDNAPYSARKAKELDIIDAVEHRQQFVDELKKKYGVDAKLDKDYGKKKAAQVNLASPFAIFKIWADIIAGPKSRVSNKDAVAVVYINGPILLGHGDHKLFGSSGIAYSTPIRRALDKAARDTSVKAVVLRINSPGGSPVASEIILNATKRLARIKPIVVSMGDVAGSGGYYVACGVDTIFANASTITGSIGVVAGKFVTTEMWNKIGISWKSTKRGANAAILRSEDVFSDNERKKLQTWMNEIYDVFKSHVVAIRGVRLRKKIDELAGGRVYTGSQALELGLVDKIGSLDDAIQHVATQVNLNEYEIRVIPKPKNFLENLLGDVVGKSDDDRMISMSVNSRIPNRSTLLIKVVLPYLRGLDSSRVNAVQTAIFRMGMLQREHAMLIMPVIQFRN